MRRPVVLLASIAFLVSLVACGDSKSDDDKASGPTTTLSAGATTTETVPGATTTVGSSATSLPAGAPSTTTKSSSSQTTVTAKGGVTTVPDTSPHPATPGTYTLDNKGATHIRGCFSSDRPAPTPTPMRVDPPAGTRQQFAVGTSPDTMTTILEFRADGAYLVMLRIEQPQLGTIQFDANPPVLAVPARPTAGTSWKFTLVSNDGKYTAATTNRIEAVDQPVALGDGSTVTTSRLKRDVTLTGQSSFGRVNLRLITVEFDDLAHSLIAKSIADTDGTVGACKVTGHVESTLRSTTPA